MNIPPIEELIRIQQLHDCAMDQAEDAVLCQMRGNSAGFRSATKSALDYEREAANLVTAYVEYEPSRSVLHRSAAALALDLGEWRIAEQLVCAALAGNPPAEIATELRDILEQSQFDHHFQLRGLILSESDALITLVGPAVAPGLIVYREFRQRIDAAERLFLRTAERKMNLPYREESYIPAAMLKDFRLSIGLSQAASYAMPIHLGDHQLSFAEMKMTPSIVLDEVLACVQALNRSEEELKQRISDPIYFRNFVGLHKQLAPDGEQIKTVGFTVIREGKPRIIAVQQVMSAPIQTKQKKTSLQLIDDSALTEQKVDRPNYVEGYLLAASEINTNIIRLRNDAKETYRVHVPEGMMSDIVKPLWGEKVRVTGRITKSRIELEDIQRVPENGSAA